MRFNVLTALDLAGLAPQGTARRARRQEEVRTAARDWLMQQATRPLPQDTLKGPGLCASGEYLASLAPALRAVFGLEAGGIRIVPTAERVEDEHATRWPEGEARAALELVSLLRCAYPEKDVSVTASSDLQPDTDWEKCNLVLLGGPKANQLTESAWKEMRVPYDFVGPHSHQLVDANGQVIFAFKQEARTVVDCAILVRGPSPFARDRKILTMVGIETQGVCAAAVCAESRDWLKVVAPQVIDLTSFHGHWEVTADLHDPWPLTMKFLRPMQELPIR